MYRQLKKKGHALQQKLHLRVHAVQQMECGPIGLSQPVALTFVELTGRGLSQGYV